MHTIYTVFIIVCTSLLTISGTIIYNKISLRNKKRKENRARTCKW